MGDHLRFRTEDSEYEDSEGSVDIQEDSDKEEEVLGFQSSSDDSDDNDVADSDIDKRDDDRDDLPNERAWGKNKHTYYSAGADLDYTGNQDKDIDDAEIEEEEAKKIQQRLLEQFDDDDFTFALDLFKENKDDTQEDIQLDHEELIKKDLSKLTKREKLALLKKESPEFLGLVNDFKAKNQEIINYLAPILDLVKQNKIPEDLLTHFVKTKFDILANYLLHINFYLLLKSARVDLKYHPVVKRLVQYRDLNNQLESIYQETVLPQIIRVLDSNKAGLLPLNNEHDKKVKKTKTLNILKIKKEMKKNKTLKEEEESSMDEFDDDIDYQNMENENIDNETVDNKNNDIEDIDNMDNDNDVDMEEEYEDIGDKKRAITYQMKKNKGLTPHRKKEQRNPRVKNRNKYRKAKIRRKGQVREVRKEISRYGGEISGIKASVSKSIKIK